MTENEISVYCDKIGLGPMLNWGTYQRRMLKTYGTKYADFSVAVDKRISGVDIDPYPLKNASAGLSVAIASQYFGNYYRELFQWLDSVSTPSIRSILDLGCENGIITCFLATVFPDAKIVGVDRSREAIAVGDQLKERLFRKNVSFVHSDLDNFLNTSEQKFDLVLTSLVVHEWLRESTIGYMLETPEFWEGQDAVDNYAALHTAKLSLVARTITENGLWVSVDRLPNPASYAFWIKEINAAGLSIDLSLSCSVKVSVVSKEDTQEIFPIIVAGHKIITPLSWNQVLSLYTAVDFADFLKSTIEGWHAELFFRSLIVEDVVLEVETTYDNGTERVMVATTPTLAIYYKHSTLGFRRITTAPKVGIWRLAKEALNICKNQPNITVRYGSDEAKAILTKI